MVMRNLRKLYRGETHDNHQCFSPSAIENMRTEIKKITPNLDRFFPELEFKITIKQEERLSCLLEFNIFVWKLGLVNNLLAINVESKYGNNV